MAKRASDSAVFLFIRACFFIFLCIPGVVQAAERVSQDTDTYLESLGLDRNFHKCTSVADGDTITLEGLGTVRFVGVDTPEKNHPKLPVQFLSEAAGAFTASLCLGKMIRLEYDFNDKDLRGNYGRVLGFAYLADGTFLQEALIKNGYSIAYTKYPFDKDRKVKFLSWEQQARQRGVGLWQHKGLAEVAWILTQEQPLLQVAALPDGKWEIFFGNWKSGKIQSGKLENHLARLYSSIYEFSPGDLLAKMAELQYRPISAGNSSTDPVFVFGMSHRTWGIIYNGYAMPRVGQGELDLEMDRLAATIISSSVKESGPAFPASRFLPLAGEPPDIEDSRTSAEKFLTIQSVGSGGKNIIPWDLAGRHVGERKTVEGIIARTHNSGTACFLNFHNNWTRYFSLVIFGNVFHRFEEKPEQFYLNRRVRVSGKIKLYRGRPEMVIEHPAQISIID